MLMPLATYKKMTGFTHHRIAYRLGISIGHVSGIINKGVTLTPRISERLEKIKEFERKNKYREMVAYINAYEFCEKWAEI